jgi:hypothetical protein
VAAGVWDNLGLGIHVPCSCLCCAAMGATVSLNAVIAQLINLHDPLTQRQAVGVTSALTRQEGWFMSKW